MKLSTYTIMTIICLSGCSKKQSYRNDTPLTKKATPVIEIPPNTDKRDTDIEPPPRTNNPVPPGTGNGPGNTTVPFTLVPRPTTDRIADDFIPFFEEGEDALRDLGRVRREDGNDVPFIRYISFSFLDFLDLNDNQIKELKASLIDSLSATVNSLSQDEIISKPIAINDYMSLFRIDIRDYGWNQGEWDRLTDDYPYANNFDDSVIILAQQIGDFVPIVRADWLAFEGTTPNRYYDLLNIPANLGNLEQAAGVNRIDDIIRQIDRPDGSIRVLRSAIGAGKSGKSPNNRVIDRHRSNNGSFWVSYDFDEPTNETDKNIFSSPFGPSPFINDVVVNGSSDVIEAFEPDGHQIIFSLNNGLHGYAIMNANRNRINAADPSIVFDQSNRDDQGIIEASSSCLRCHAGGIRTAQDELREFMESADDELFNDDIRDAVFNLHPEPSRFSDVVASDNERYLSNLQLTNIIGSQPTDLPGLINYYDRDMTKDMVASELNITSDQYERFRPRLSVELRIKLQPLDNGKLDRETFEEIFPDLIEEFFNLRI